MTLEDIRNDSEHDSYIVNYINKDGDTDYLILSKHQLLNCKWAQWYLFGGYKNDILIVCDSPKQRDEIYKDIWHRVAYISHRFEYNGLNYMIWANHYRIRIVSSKHKEYRGQRPGYFYAYGTEVVSYLASTGSKRLNSLDEIVELVKGE